MVSFGSIGHKTLLRSLFHGCVSAFDAFSLRLYMIQECNFRLFVIPFELVFQTHNQSSPCRSRSMCVVYDESIYESVCRILSAKTLRFYIPNKLPRNVILVFVWCMRTSQTQAVTSRNPNRWMENRWRAAMKSSNRQGDTHKESEKEWISFGVLSRIKRWHKYTSPKPK